MDLPTFLQSTALGNGLSFLGILIALAGFILTIRLARQSRTAAQEAHKAVLRMRDDLRKANTMAEFSEALARMKEIKRLHRDKKWGVLPDEYSSLRSLLVTIKTRNPNLPDDQKTAIQNALLHFMDMENQVEKALQKSAQEPDAVQLNSVVSKQIDRLQAILVAIESTIGG